MFKEITPEKLTDVELEPGRHKGESHGAHRRAAHTREPGPRRVLGEDACPSSYHQERTLEHRLSRQPTLRPWPQPSHWGMATWEMKQRSKKVTTLKALRGLSKTKGERSLPIQKARKPDTGMKGARIMDKWGTSWEDRILNKNSLKEKKDKFTK